MSDSQGTPAGPSPEVDRALAFIDQELRGMAFRRDALLHIRGLLVGSHVIREWQVNPPGVSGG